MEPEYSSCTYIYRQIYTHMHAYVFLTCIHPISIKINVCLFVCGFVCLFEVYRRLNGWIDFLEILTVPSYMPGRRNYRLILLKIFYFKISSRRGATPTYSISI